MATALDAGLDLVATLELDRLVQPLLAALARAADAQGGALYLADERGGLTLKALRGLVDVEALPSRVEVGEGELASALRRGEPFADPAFLPGEVELVPLVHDRQVAGLVVLDHPSAGTRAPAPAALVELARLSALALRNAVRVQALVRAAALGRTAPRSLEDHLGQELLKARRYGRYLSLALVGVDEDAARAAGDPPPPGLQKALGVALERAVRDADLVAASANAYQVLLPETDAFGALAFQQRATEEMRRQPELRVKGGPLALAFGTATYPGDGESAEALVEACHARQAERRRSLLGEVSEGLRDDPAAFWELADALLEGSALAPRSPSALLPLAAGLLEAMERELIREIGRDPKLRRTLYLGGARCGGVLPAPLAEAGRAAPPGARVYLLGSSDAAAPAHPLLTRVPVSGDRRLADHAFLILLAPRAAYALLEGPGGRIFHTADAPLVLALASKLERRYELEPL